MKWFTTDAELKSLIQHEVKVALSQQTVAIVTKHNTVCGDMTFISHPQDPRYRSIGETVQTVEIPKLLTQIICALKLLGVEVYNVPKQSAEWGLRLKKDK